jgi:transcriptional regulator GlxA family with amidase domain
VLILTGYSTEALAIRAIEAQVAGYLKKPPHLGKLRATLERWVDAAAPVDEPLAHVRRLLEAHPERPHTTAALAQAVGLSERHMRRQFRDRYGKTPRRFLTEVRLQTTAHLLLTTSLGIEQIALQVGYQSVSSFSRSFKRVFGMSPSAFREQRGRP